MGRDIVKSVLGIIGFSVIGIIGISRAQILRLGYQVRQELNQRHAVMYSVIDSNKDGKMSYDEVFKFYESADKNLHSSIQETNAAQFLTVDPNEDFLNLRRTPFIDKFE